MQQVPTPPIRIRVLGGYAIEVDGRPLQFGRKAPRRPLDLLAALIALGGRSVSTGALADQLWPEADGFDAQRALTITLHRLRRLLGYPGAVRLCAGRLAIDPALCWVDAWELERTLRNGHSAPGHQARFDLLAAPFLGDDPSPWAIGARRRLQSLARLDSAHVSNP